MKRAETDRERFARHAARGVILDSNLLVIYLVGLHDTKAVERFLPGGGKGKVVCFPEDFGIIKSLINDYSVKRFIVTPHILTEVSNLTFNHFFEPHLEEYLKRAFAFFRLAKEMDSSKDDLLKEYHLPILGFSDSAIVETAKKGGYLVLTEDLKCAHILEEQNCCVYNMNHLRTFKL